MMWNKDNQFDFSETPIRVDGSNLKYVKNIKYIGNIVNSNASLDNEIVNRISCATNAFGKLNTRLRKDQGISLKTKLVV